MQDSVYGNSDTGDVGFTEDIRNALERLFFQFQACRHFGLPLSLRHKQEVMQADPKLHTVRG